MSEPEFSESIKSDMGRELFCMSVELPELGLVAYAGVIEPDKGQDWHRQQFRAQLKDAETIERLRQEKRNKDMTQRNESPRITGTIKAVKDEQTISEKFRKREIVVDTGGDYPQVVAIEFVNDKIDLILNCEVGDSVDVDVNIRGREWRSPSGDVRHFVSLSGWRINIEKKYRGQGQGYGGQDQNRQRPEPPSRQDFGPPPGDDDIPF